MATLGDQPYLERWQREDQERLILDRKLDEQTFPRYLQIRLRSQAQLADGSANELFGLSRADFTAREAMFRAAKAYLRYTPDEIQQVNWMLEPTGQRLGPPPIARALPRPLVSSGGPICRPRDDDDDDTAAWADDTDDEDFDE